MRRATTRGNILGCHQHDDGDRSKSDGQFWLSKYRVPRLAAVSRLLAA
jgi:hypothetical protein